MRRYSLCLVVLLAAPAHGEGVTVASWGGAYERAQREAIIEPWRAQGGEAIIVSHGGAADMAERANAERWDVMDMEEGQAIAACEAGALMAIQPHDVATPTDGAPLEEDFVRGAFRRCSVTQNLFASVIAYDEKAFPGVKPTQVEDFFDLARFPGKRALRRSPDDILEWALMAQGVPASQVYDLLSTDRGLRLAFRKLDEIRDHIIWWEDPADPPRLLREGEATVASGFNGRFFDAAKREGARIVIVWDGRILGREVWAIPARARNPQAARAFLRFATAPERMAGLSERIPYGPARRSALSTVGLHPEVGTPMLDQLPNSPHHGRRALERDSEWHANTSGLRGRRFRAWLGASAD